MKKTAVIVLILVLALMFALAGCKGADDSPEAVDPNPYMKERPDQFAEPYRDCILRR